MQEHTAPLPVGTRVILSNRLTNFATSMFDGLFILLSIDEILKLEIDDEVYIQLDQPRRHGDIHGWRKAKVSALEVTTEPRHYGRACGVYFESKHFSGVCWAGEFTNLGIGKALDEAEVAKRLTALPLSNVIDPRQDRIM